MSFRLHEFEGFFNRIWSLPQLTHCRLDIKGNFRITERISPSIIYMYVSISSECWSFSHTVALLRQTPRLQRFHTSLNYLNNDRNQLLPTHRSLTILKLSDVQSSHLMTTILQVVPNLTHLKVDTYCIIYDGYQWETLIDNCLPKLKILRIRMNVQFDEKKNSEQLIWQFVDSFRTPFWLEKHQWFTHSNHTSYAECQFVLLHTIPCGFRDFSFNFLGTMYQSNCPRDDEYSAYENVHHLSYVSLKTNPLPSIHFPHVRHLDIVLPFNTSFWRHLPMLDQLRTLSVFSTDKNASLHLQSLLDRAPYLYSLKIEAWPTDQVPATQNTSPSLRRLDLPLLQESCRRGSASYDREQCEILTQSSLGIQCEELLIPIQNQESTLDLVMKMPHLRTLCVKYPLDERCWRDNSRYRDEVEKIVEWLHHNLPSTCTISNCMYDSGRLTIWILLNKS